MAKARTLMKSRASDVQTINVGGSTFALLARADYEKLLESAGENAMLIRAAEAARGEGTFPADVAKRLVAGEAPLKVIREWRNLTQQELHEASGVAKNYISQIERKERDLGHKAAEKLAPVLKVSPNDLMV